MIADRAELEQLLAETERRFLNLAPTCPPHWGGYRLLPERVEFWQGRPSRLHDRLNYRLVDGRWMFERLAPEAFPGGVAACRLAASPGGRPMLELDSTLAQHIVDRAMAILPHNINVMDAQGMIIGSGDPLRIHTRHEGAQLVLANRRVVEIDEQAAACLRGVRPGVNLPLFHAERLIGVLGITGEPDTVRPYAELVRMAAEMLVEQRQLQAERHWQRHQLDAWLNQLADPRTDLVQLAAEAERIGLQLPWRQQVCVLELMEEGDPAERRARVLDGLARQGCWVRHCPPVN